MNLIFFSCWQYCSWPFVLHHNWINHTLYQWCIINKNQGVSDQLLLKDVTGDILQSKWPWNTMLTLEPHFMIRKLWLPRFPCICIYLYCQIFVRKFWYSEAKCHLFLWVRSGDIICTMKVECIKLRKLNCSIHFKRLFLCTKQ